MKKLLLGIGLFLFFALGSAVSYAQMGPQVDAVGNTVWTTQLGLSETTTPTAVTGFGQVYTATDNILYFQDGAGTAHPVCVTNSAQTFTSTIGNTGNAVTVGSGTGLTVVDTGTMRSQVYIVTLDYTGLSAAATSAAHTIATLPAGMKLVSVIADTTTEYTGGSVSAATIAVGIASGNVDAFLEEHDVFSAAIVVGDATADPGVELIAATDTQGGYINWAGTTAVSAIITTTSDNTDALTQGSTTYYLETVQIK